MSDVQFFHDGVARGELLVRVCSACGLGAFPPMPGCPHCGEEAGAVVQSSGEGTLYSWTVCHIAFDPAFAEDAPYVVGLVDIPEGARIIARVDAPTSELAAGLPLRADFPLDAEGARRLVFTATGTGA